MEKPTIYIGLRKVRRTYEDREEERERERERERDRD